YCSHSLFLLSLGYISASPSLISLNPEHSHLRKGRVSLSTGLLQLSPQCISEGVGLKLKGRRKRRIGSGQSIGCAVYDEIIQIWNSSLPGQQHLSPPPPHERELLPATHTCPPSLVGGQLREDW